MGSAVMSVAEAARALGISRALVARGIASGELPIGVKVQGRYVVSRAAVERFVETGRFEPPGAGIQVEDLARAVAVEVVRLLGRTLAGQIHEGPVVETTGNERYEVSPRRLGRLGGTRR